MTRQKYKANSFRVDAATIILQLNLGWGLYRVSYLLAISLVYASDNFARELDVKSVTTPAYTDAAPISSATGARQLPLYLSFHNF